MSLWENISDIEVVDVHSKVYDQKRRIFNGLIDRRPKYIVYPESDDALLKSFERVLASGLPFSIRAGGHNVAGTSVLDDGVVVDTSRLFRVAVNRVERTVKVQPGALWRDVDSACAKFDLCTPGGIISDTGVAGLTLGGGIGWLNGLYGLSCDNLVEARVKLACGRQVRVNDEEYPELLWALRGAGGNFGLVTEFVLRLHVMKPLVAGSIIYRASGFKESLEKYAQLCAGAEDEFTASWVATFRKGERIISLDVCYMGEVNSGYRTTEKFLPLKQAELISDTREIRTYVNWQRMFDEDRRRGLRSYWRAVFVPDPSDNSFIELVSDFYRSCPSVDTMLTFDHIHGVAARTPVEFAAYPHRSKMFLFLINANWRDPERDKENLQWANQFFLELKSKLGEANYVNYLSLEGLERIKAAYGETNFRRLCKIKERYDPRNLFRSNQNIPVKLR